MISCGKDFITFWLCVVVIKRLFWSEGNIVGVDRFFASFLVQLVFTFISSSSSFLTFHQTWVKLEQNDDSENFEVFLDVHGDQLMIMIHTNKHSASMHDFLSSMKLQ